MTLVEMSSAWLSRDFGNNGGVWNR